MYYFIILLENKKIKPKIKTSKNFYELKILIIQLNFHILQLDYKIDNLSNKSLAYCLVGHF